MCSEAKLLAAALGRACAWVYCGSLAGALGALSARVVRPWAEGHGREVDDGNEEDEGMKKTRSTANNTRNTKGMVEMLGAPGPEEHDEQHGEVGHVLEHDAERLASHIRRGRSTPVPSDDWDCRDGNESTRGQRTYTT